MRDNNLRRALAGLVRGKTVLELGCGEGHLTETILRDAKSVTAVDISQIAIERAVARKIKNACFVQSDFLEQSFTDHDVIAALECICYLSRDELNRFLQKVTTEHKGRTLAVSIPIIGSNEHRIYFTHAEMMALLSHHDFSNITSFNLTVYWRPALARVIANLCKLPLGHLAVDFLPDRFIYQRLYVATA